MGTGGLQQCIPIHFIPILLMKHTHRFEPQLSRIGQFDEWNAPAVCIYSGNSGSLNCALRIGVDFGKEINK